jgi:hypothetical protein
MSHAHGRKAAVSPRCSVTGLCRLQLVGHERQTQWKRSTVSSVRRAIFPRGMRQAQAGLLGAEDFANLHARVVVDLPLVSTLDVGIALWQPVAARTVLLAGMLGLMMGSGTVFGLAAREMQIVVRSASQGIARAQSSADV